MKIDAVTLIAVSMAISSISMTVAKTKVFAPMRDWVFARNEWLGNLISCPYCLSHWLTFAAVAWYQPKIIESQIVFFDLIVSIFAIVAIAAIVSGIMTRLLWEASDTGKSDAEIEKLKDALQKAKQIIIKQNQEITDLKK